METTGRVAEFMRERILPVEADILHHQYTHERRWTEFHPACEDLKEQAQAEGLFNLFLPVDSDPDGVYGAGFTNLEYATMAELTGHSLVAPEVFSCSAPDTGNRAWCGMARTRKGRWLKPLLAGGFDRALP